MQTSLKINYQYTKNPLEAVRWLRSLPDTIACDFEAASRFTDEEKGTLQLEFDGLDNQGTLYAHQLKQKIDSDGLSHPSLANITHFSLAWSETDAMIFITDTPKMRKIIFNWLVNTDIKQVWHNASFDFQHIFHHMDGRLPKNYEDTQILAKSILNHVNVFKSKVGLKELMGYKYGSWAVSSDSFHLSRMYDEDVIRYAGIDACATYALWEEMQEYLEEEED